MKTCRKGTTGQETTTNIIPGEDSKPISARRIMATVIKPRTGILSILISHTTAIIMRFCMTPT
jgi:hypothetical protein